MKVKWEEPIEFFRACLLSQGNVPTRRGRLLAGIFVGGVVSFLALAFEWFFFWLHKKDLGVPLYFYFVAPVISGVFAYFLPVMIMAIPYTIILNERGIYRNKPYGKELSVEFWPWESISEMAIQDVQFGEEVFRVLVVRTQLEPGEIVIGIDGAPLDRINALVTQMGKTITSRV